MSEVQEPLRDVYLDTSEAPPNEVMFWSSRGEHLSGKVNQKAALLTELGCIKYVGDDSHLSEKSVFICLPINMSEEIVVDGRVFKKTPAKHYNSTVYWIRKYDKDTFKCSCQGWAAAKKRDLIVPGMAGCAHVLALYHAFKNKRFSGGVLI